MNFKLKLSDDEKNNILNLARKTIEFYLIKKKKPALKEFHLELPEIMNDHLGIFVTLHKNDDLRGCIGYVKGYMPLSKALIDNAINAACKDPRFNPVVIEELANIRIEISILSPIEQVQDINDIKIGTHGLIISKGTRCGLLLPQVATEYNWSKEEFLEHTCMKAGLDKSEWKNDSKIEFFSATVFSEK